MKWTEVFLFDTNRVFDTIKVFKSTIATSKMRVVTDGLTVDAHLLWLERLKESEVSEIVFKYVTGSDRGSLYRKRMSMR